MWSRLATDLKPKALDVIAGRTVSFEEMPDLFEDYIQSRVTGRTIVKISDE